MSPSQQHLRRSGQPKPVRRSMTRLRRLAALTVTAALALAACSSPSNPVSDGSAASSAGNTSATDDSAAGSGTASGPITVTDDADRSFTFPGVVHRVISINSYNAEILAALGVRDTIVGTDNTTLDRLSYLGLPKSAGIGPDYSELNYELIASLKPDLVIIPSGEDWQGASSHLEAFHIPVLVVTGYDVTVWNKNVTLLGQLFGAQQKAAEILKFTDGIKSLVDDRVKGLPTVKIYYEDTDANASQGKGGPKTAVINEVAGVNVFGQRTGPSGSSSITVDPTEIIKANPDLVFREYSNTYQKAGTGILQGVAQELASRPGWNQLTAVKNKDVYVYNAALVELAGRNLELVFYAKWAHPAAFTDIDPFTYVKQWEQFTGADFSPENAYVDKLGS